ncbi:MAG: tyrosine-protein phosphatase [Kiritimatiellae bacterium]|nr:tyrosine-protein phosphatase [Kiritimatiellia bacterium]
MRQARIQRLLGIIATLGWLLGALCSPAASVPPENLRVAFVGDFYLETCADIARLVRDENADLLVLLGDLAHTGDTNKIRQWDAIWTDYLGTNFPVFACVGNHDAAMWRVPGGYQHYLAQRMQRVPDVVSTGEIGITNTVQYKGLTFVFSGIGMDAISGNAGTPIPVGSRAKQTAYMAEALSRSDSIWRLAVWHMNMAKAQVTKKGNATGWEIYEAAGLHGALVFNGHCHAYARSHLMAEWSDSPVIASTASPVMLEEGTTALIISALGGQSPYAQRRNDAWWAEIYATDVDGEWNGIEKGVTFIDFHVDGQPNKARGYFRTVSGQIVDRFTILSNVATEPSVPAAPSSLTANASSSSQIELAWQDNSTDETGFKIDRRQSGTGPWVRVTQTSANVTRHTDGGLMTATEYYYKVKAFNAEGDSAYVGPLGVTTFSAGMTVLDVRVAAGADDAEEDAATGAMSLDSTDLELVRDSADQFVGMRFASLLIPGDVVIRRAYVQFVVDEASSETTALTLRGQAADNAAPFSTAGSDISSRPRTTAAVTWQPPAWNAIGDAGPAQQTPDLSALVREIVSRPGWRAGNALAIVVTGSGHREADSYDGNPGTAPLLHIEYESGDTNVSLTASPCGGETVPDTRSAADPFTPHAADEDLSTPQPTRLSWQLAGLAAGVTFDVFLAETPALGPPHALVSGTSQTDASAWNLKIDTDYYWQVVAKRDGNAVAQTGVLHFRTAPYAPRWIRVDGTTNVRDIGGRITRDGQRVRQGLLFRSAQFDAAFQISAEGEQTIRALGIRTEHDLRADGTRSLAIDGIDYVRTGCWGFSGFYETNLPATAPLYAAAIRALAVTNRYPVILHCTHGADRTGAISFLLEALLGCTEEEICLDYEWTTLSVIGERTREADKFQNAIRVLKAYDPAAGTLQAGVWNFLAANGVSETELHAVRALFLDSTPGGRVPKRTAWKYRSGTGEASRTAWAWRTAGFDDSGWAVGEAPFGYSSELSYGTTLTDMRDTYTSVFLRKIFTLDAPASVSRVDLAVDYDDGFIAWINGHEVARVNVQGAVGEFIAHDAVCAGYVAARTANWTAGLTGPQLPELQATNVLAVQVFNNTIGSGDLMFDAALSVVRSPMSVAEDADRDALPDAWEAIHLSDLSDPTDRSDSGDPDGDGLCNLEEYIAGTDPRQNGSWFAVDVGLVDGRIVVSFPTVTASGAGYDGLTRHYALEQRIGTDPAAAWLAVAGYEDVPGTGMTAAYTSADAEAHACYRARVWLQ